MNYPDFLYRYRLTCDSGTAPCVFKKNMQTTPDLLTLACCKGGTKNKRASGMRRTIGDRFYEQYDTENMERKRVWVAGMSGTGNNFVRENKGCLLYVAELHVILTMREYFGSGRKGYGGICSKGRLDDVYDVMKASTDDSADDYKAEGILKRNRNNPLFHGKDDEENHVRDVVGKYVLVSKEFVYLGSECRKYELCSDIAKIFPAKQGHLPTKNAQLCGEGDEQAIKLFCNYLESCSLLDNSGHLKSYCANTPNTKLIEGCSGCRQR